MPWEHAVRRRVEFAETDVAGIAHFANWFRWMEACEHDFFRRLGSSVHPAEPEGVLGWPRVHVSCDWRHPLRFEDEFVVTLLVRERAARTVTWDFAFTRPAADQLLARGRIVSACVGRVAGEIRAIPIPAALAAAIEPAPPAALQARDAAWERQGAERAARRS